jgi:ribonucleoside-diphosphate reductase alpha chain
MCILLNRIIDKNRMPFKELQKAMLSTRKIGIGIMGWADYCLLHNLKYGSEESLIELKRLLNIIKQSAIETSSNLDYPKIYKGRCNANLLSIAPCGTIATVLGASFSIEPPFGWVYERRILDGSIQLEENAIFKERFPDLDAETLSEIKRRGTIQDLDVFNKEDKKIFRVSFEIPSIEHLNTQAAAQEIVDLGVSKTINLSETASIEDVKNIYLKAWEMGCKGITIYRNNSKQDQPISWNLDLACASGKCEL